MIDADRAHRRGLDPPVPKDGVCNFDQYFSCNGILDGRQCVPVSQRGDVERCRWTTVGARIVYVAVQGQGRHADAVRRDGACTRWYGLATVCFASFRVPMNRSMSCSTVSSVLGTSVSLDSAPATTVTRAR